MKQLSRVPAFLLEKEKIVGKTLKKKKKTLKLGLFYEKRPKRGRFII